VEFVVFIEGFAHTGDWESAKELSLAANKYGNNIRPTLCELWNDLSASTVPSPERENAAANIFEKLNCEF
jgi:hypothetical protein